MIVLLDNYDSFVHNLARYVRLQDCETSVIRSDQITPDEILQMRPDGILLSPGPNGPVDAGCCVPAVQQMSGQIPILGVCLGHQSIGYAFGADVVTGPPMHGRQSQIQHDDPILFAHCDQPMPVARYHSLVLQPDSIPDVLRVTATTLDDAKTVMAVRHVDHPTFGVQFHPESVLSPQGMHIIKNFVAHCTAGSRTQDANT